MSALRLAAFAGLAILLAPHVPASAPFQEAPQAIRGVMETVVLDPREFNYAYGPTEYERMQQAVTNAPTATFNVTYTGFTAEAQAAFQAAVDIWANVIVSPVPIRVRASFTNFANPSILGSAGPTVVCTNSKGVPSTWYAAALADKINGSSYCAGLLSPPETHELAATFSSSFSNWDFGTSGTPVSGKISFLTVVMHELGHGLGFYGSMTASGGVGSYDSPPDIYDRFAITGSGTPLLNFPNNSTSLGSQLVSNNTFFNGTNATSNNGGVNPKLETQFFSTSADNGFRQGSSYSHIDDALYTATPNGLMTYAIGFAEVYTDPGPITRGIFTDEGWGQTAPTIATQPSSQTIASGQTATLSVVANGSSLSYQWYLGTSGTTSSPISGATSSSYTTPTLTSTTSYWVRVSNSGGSADSSTATVTVSGPVTNPAMSIDGPGNNSVVYQPFLTGGWAVDRGASTGVGVDAVHVWAYPLLSDGSVDPDSSHWRFVAQGVGGGLRSDVGDVFGAQFNNCGFTFVVQGLPNGNYILVVYARSTVTGTFNQDRRVMITVRNTDPFMSIDGPTEGSVVNQPFLTGGWAVDLASKSGVGVNDVHVWAYPVVNGVINPNGIFVVQGTGGGTRTDVGNVFGRQFDQSGFTFVVNGLPTGQYVLGVYCRSSVTGNFQGLFRNITVQ